jgi:hypothetical protein
MRSKINLSGATDTTIGAELVTGVAITVAANLDETSPQEPQLLSLDFKTAPQPGQTVISTYFSQAQTLSIIYLNRQRKPHRQFFQPQADR